MRILTNRWGAAIELRNHTVISLGWNVWGIDAPSWYFMFHIWRPRIFMGKGL